MKIIIKLTIGIIISFNSALLTNGCYILDDLSKYHVSALEMIVSFRQTMNPILWINNGEEFLSVYLDTNNQIPAIPDGDGGFYLGYSNYNSSSNSRAIYIKRMDLNGNHVWPDSYKVVSSHQSDIRKEKPLIIFDNSGGAIIAWMDNRDTNIDIYTQRINSSGDILWIDDGVVVCDDASDQYLLSMIADGSGGAIIVWQDTRNSDMDIFAQRVNASGIAQWASNGVPICDYSGDQGATQVVSDLSGGAIIAWTDERNADRDIFAQRVNASGITQWTSNGVPICVQPGDQDFTIYPSFGYRGKKHIAMVQTGGAIIGWEDSRYELAGDIYIQKIDINGVPQWGTNGKLICDAIKNQFAPLVTTDNENGAFLAWEDNRESEWGDIYAQHIDSSGNLLWDENVRLITTNDFPKSWLNIEYHNSQVLLLSWADRKNYPLTNYDIYMQGITKEGELIWNEDMKICSADYAQNYPLLISSYNNVILLWQDLRHDSRYSIFGQKIMIK